MRHLDWVQESGVWRSGPYRIESIAPRLWVLSRSHRRAAAGDAPVLATMELTAPSLRAAKEAAETIETRRRRRRDLRAHSILAGSAAAGVAGLATIPEAWVLPMAAAVALVWLRSISRLMELLLGGSHRRIREIYQ